MVTSLRNKIGSSLLLVATAWFAFYGCSSSDQEEEQLEAGQEEAAEVSPLDGPAIGEDGAVAIEGAADLGNAGEGMGLGDGLGGDVAAEGDAAAAAAADVPVAGSAEVANGEFFNYTVVGGDWMSKLAGRVYGDVQKWHVIAAANPQITNPNRIFPGDVIKVPITGASSKAFADSYQK